MASASLSKPYFIQYLCSLSPLVFQILNAMYFFDEADALFDPSWTFFPALYASEHVEALILHHGSEYHFSLLLGTLRYGTAGV